MPESKTPTPEAYVRSFISRFDPKSQKLFRSVRAALRKRFPTANELAYDYNDSVVIGFSPTEGGIDSILAIALRSEGVRLYFTYRPQMPDPKKLLLGTAKQTRYIHVEAASRLTHPDVKALINAAMDLAKVPLPSNGEGKLIIRTGAAKQRPRRSSKK
jgi:hypothetical protein